MKEDSMVYEADFKNVFTIEFEFLTLSNYLVGIRVNEARFF